MPELPEVEIIKNNLSDYLIDKTIHSIEVFTNKLRYKIPHNLAESIKNQRVTDISRIAKYIIVDLENKYSLLIHLGMTGNFLINAQKMGHNDNKHVRLRFKMSDQSEIDYIDIRKFGFFKLVNPQKVEIKKLKAELGPDALSDEFDIKYLQESLKNRVTNIKSALLNQKIVGGIGNIYASEALFRAKISPMMESGKVVKNKIKTGDLISSIKFILHDAIKVGGSTIRDHKNLKGESGYFQYKFNVYNRENMICNSQNCSAKIKKIVQTGRSTFYCTKCQKMRNR
ncbi:MAG: bifunctional DNA-formamidopyrimidine glycosylase/DNA-(apurinic or apyrimidinic site) lyase [Pseudomonadota bacterium]|nr:bifunctional DNA-formamidopyrimidine glycosylase/DNA-(apurinic or apyrimidinic site) lyase [Pseudomonadota bacterium]